MPEKTYTEQAEQMTQGLLACGLKQEDFRLIEDLTGSRPLVVFNIPIEQQIALAEQLGNYFHVDINYENRKPTGVVIRLAGEEPSSRSGSSPIVFHWEKGVYPHQVRSVDKCERCHDTFKPAELIIFDYNGTEVVVCFPCCKVVVNALMQLPLEERTPRLQMLRERWAESEAVKWK